ncbi:MAG: LTA synthase family protein [Cytophagaceae bacterium]|nr:LTA synthase family protein [Cytophagaceae bacterium]
MVVNIYKKILLGILLLLALFQFERILFYAYQHASFQQGVSLPALMLAFLHGIRFDLSLVLVANIPWIIGMLLPYRWALHTTYQLCLNVLFVLVNLPLLAFNLVDLHYFAFTGKRTGAEILLIQSDVQAQLGQLIMYYWDILVLFLLIGMLLVLGVWRIKATQVYAWKKHALLFLFLIPPMVVGIRGGIQFKPLKPDHAFVHEPAKLGNLALNTSYNFFATLGLQRLEDAHYMSETAMKARLQTLIPPVNPNAKPQSWNVVLLIMESFASEYSGLYPNRQSYIPFFDSLARQSYFFPSHYTNGRRSIDALPSLLAGMPTLMNEPFITGVYQSNELHGFPERLKEQGYRTFFFHGGKTGTMGFDKFSDNCGIQEYFGKEDYPEPEKDFDGNWGIYDEPFLQWMGTRLSAAQQPFLAVAFTLSSHQPYSIPVKYKGRFPKGKLPIHESLGYADYSLKKFFEYASKQSWYSNTLFILTADHTQEMEYPEHRNVIDEFLVPLVIFKPGTALPLDTTRVTQHCDVPSTVLDLLGVPSGKSLYFGQSMTLSSPGRAIHFTDGEHRLLEKNFFLVRNQQGQSKMYSINDPFKRNEITNDTMRHRMLQDLHMFIQYYNNGLNHNSWYRYNE